MGASWPSLFTFSGVSRYVGVATTEVEQTCGIGGTRNASTIAAAIAGKNGLPPPPSILTRAENVLASPFVAAEKKASAAWAATKADAAAVYDTTAGTFTGAVSLVHWLVIGAIAAAALYAFLTFRSVAP